MKVSRHPASWLLGMAAAVASVTGVVFTLWPDLAAGLVLLLAAALWPAFRRNPYRGSVTVAVESAEHGIGLSVREHAGISELDPNAREPTGALRPMGSADPEQAPSRLVPVSVGNAPRAPAGRRWLVQLEIDRAAEQYPWERRLDYGADGRALANVLPFRREPGAWRTIGRLAWLLRVSYRRRCVTRVVGTPVEAYGGSRLRVSGGKADRLDVAGLVRSSPAVVILQAEPADGPSRPLGDLWAGFVRQARSVLDSGANAVLVIPPLPDSLAAEAGVLADRRLVRRLTPPRPRDLLLLLGDLKQLTARADGDQDAILDILLFLHTHD